MPIQVRELNGSRIKVARCQQTLAADLPISTGSPRHSSGAPGHKNGIRAIW